MYTGALNGHYVNVLEVDGGVFEEEQSPPAAVNNQPCYGYKCDDQCLTMRLVNQATLRPSKTYYRNPAWLAAATVCFLVHNKKMSPSNALWVTYPTPAG